MDNIYHPEPVSGFCAINPNDGFTYSGDAAHFLRPNRFPDSHALYVHYLVKLHHFHPLSIVSVLSCCDFQLK